MLKSESCCAEQGRGNQISDRNRLNKILHFLRSVNINWLIIVPLIIAIGLMIAWAGVRPLLIGDGDLGPADLPFWVLFTFIGGLPGVAQIWRRETPDPMFKPFRKAYAVLSGIIWVAFMWGGMIFMIARTLFS